MKKSQEYIDFLLRSHKKCEEILFQVIKKREKGEMPEKVYEEILDNLIMAKAILYYAAKAIKRNFPDTAIDFNRLKPSIVKINRGSRR